ncbi:ComEA family DNA-binding protein [Corynebacterium sp. ES2715-CONJ3]|uniref:ComEA family DNA-binding protein n=1 Tax=Corynebacterium sp. ES2715-CONJ3 TaxID=2974028 RepID=UPI002168D9A9|nr:ComEA family DNA-binding protein [Corynebacterium sp. ES2715-CONJ3]MCS4492298.1 ComEA family DNA-binding protein [Corynebacterium sp. ES2715-CONJ3]
MEDTTRSEGRFAAAVVDTIRRRDRPTGSISSRRIKELYRSHPAQEELAFDNPLDCTPRLTVSPLVALVVVSVGLIGVIAVWLGAFAYESPAPQPVLRVTGAIPTPLPVAPPRTEIVVAVVGAVEHPGLYRFSDPDARIADALKRAGFENAISLAGINLAQRLTDGMQITVESDTDASIADAPAVSGGTPKRVALNSAGREELESLPGIGTKTAEAIIAYRERVGAFSTIEQLQDVKGIGPSKFAAVKDQLVL